MDQTPRCALIILNYNGRAHLDDAVGSALEAARAYGLARVIVLDNRSTEPDVAYLRERFPQLEVVVAETNAHLFSYNAFLRTIDEEIAVLLNNDMRFDKDLLAPLLCPFSDAAVFAVTANIKDWEGRTETAGQRIGYFRRSWFYRQWRRGLRRTCPTLDACGGAMAVRRERFLELGGFDPMFAPGYWEDTDLSYRAWRAGWTVLYQPSAVVYHRIGASFTAALGGDDARERLIRRNEILFTIKNCGGPGFLALYLLMLPWRALKAACGGNRALGRGFRSALPLIPTALAARRKARAGVRVDERTFLEALNGWHD